MTLQILALSVQDKIQGDLVLEVFVQNLVEIFHYYVFVIFRIAIFVFGFKRELNDFMVDLSLVMFGTRYVYLKLLVPIGSSCSRSRV